MPNRIRRQEAAGLTHGPRDAAKSNEACADRRIACKVYGRGGARAPETDGRDVDLTFSSAAEEYRRGIQELIRAELPPGWAGLGALPVGERESFRARWRQVLLDHDLLAAGWPTEYGGGGLSLVEQSIAAEEMIRAGVPQYPLPNDSNAFVLLGPTLLHAGSDEQKSFFLPPTIAGEIRWAQGYSEAGAGSDLFNVQTRAVLEGDEWVVTGHKIWTSAGVTANWIFALVRTDPAAERGKGLSFLLIPLDQPGVDVRGITNMAGEAEFAEVFFDGARTSASHVVGGVGNGAQVALALLGFERGTGGVAAALAAKIELERLVALTRSRGLGRDAGIRRRLAECSASVHMAHCLALKSLSAGLSGRPPGAESSVTKIVASTYRQRVTELALDILGEQAVALSGDPSAVPLGPQPLGLGPSSSAAWLADALHARPGTVYGGSIQIQRNTIAERALGLPREPRPSASAR